MFSLESQLTLVKSELANSSEKMHMLEESLKLKVHETTEKDKLVAVLEEGMDDLQNFIKAKAAEKVWKEEDVDAEVEKRVQNVLETMKSGPAGNACGLCGQSLKQAQIEGAVLDVSSQDAVLSNGTDEDNAVNDNAKSSAQPTEDFTVSTLPNDRGNASKVPPSPSSVYEDESPTNLVTSWPAPSSEAQPGTTPKVTPLKIRTLHTLQQASLAKRSPSLNAKPSTTAQSPEPKLRAVGSASMLPILNRKTSSMSITGASDRPAGSAKMTTTGPTGGVSKLPTSLNRKTSCVSTSASSDRSTGPAKPRAAVPSGVVSKLPSLKKKNSSPGIGTTAKHPAPSSKTAARAHAGGALKPQGQKGGVKHADKREDKGKDKSEHKSENKSEDKSGVPAGRVRRMCNSGA